MNSNHYALGKRRKSQALVVLLALICMALGAFFAPYVKPRILDPNDVIVELQQTADRVALEQAGQEYVDDFVAKLHLAATIGELQDIVEIEMNHDPLRLNNLDVLQQRILDTATQFDEVKKKSAALGIGDGVHVSTLREIRVESINDAQGDVTTINDMLKQSF